MLKNVHLKNLALIREADIDYETGLNIMTGETGSGKSIIISSINMALGDKASKSFIRSGSDFGLVELLFTSDDPAIGKLLAEMDISSSGREIIITRKITPDSTVSKINGETTTLANIRALTSKLIDIHGQHEHQSLLNQSSQLDILDNFGKQAVSDAKESLRISYNEFKTLRNRYKDFNLDETALEKEMSLAEFELKEISDASLLKDEDIKLEAEYKKLSAWEKLSESMAASGAALSSENNGAGQLIGKALAELNFALSNAPDDEELKLLKNTVTDLDSVVRDVYRDIEKYSERHAFDGERFAKIRGRLDTINRLKSRYGRTVEDILNYADNLEAKLAGFKNYNETRNDIISKMNITRSELNKKAAALSEVRKETAAKLTPMIIENLKDLNFLTAEFSIDFTRTDKISDNGWDRIDFLISTNPGEKLMPLSKVASGGELSRIMLAIKSSIAENDNMPTLIFDEIDTGISGRTAQMVGEKLNELSKSHQIICITHLPQIAAMADTHFGIHKEVDDGNTISGIAKLTDEDSAMEIAKLISGASVTKTSLESAIELKSNARKMKGLK